MKYSLLYSVMIFAGVAAGAEIDRALSLPGRTENKVFRSSIKPNWLPERKSLWYRVQTGPETYEFVLIHAETGARKTARDLKSLGLPAGAEVKSSTLKAEPHPTRRTGGESLVTFANKMDEDVDLFWINPKGERIRYGGIRPNTEREIKTFGGHVWFITSRTGEPLAVFEAAGPMETLVIDGKGATINKAKAGKPQMGGGNSPDGHWLVRVENGKVLARDMNTGKTVPIPTELDGVSPFGSEVSWAPDSQAFVLSNAAPVETRTIKIIESSPAGGGQPKEREIKYAKPGDPLPKPFPVLFRLTNNGFTGTRVKDDLFPSAFTQSGQIPIRWAPDGKEFYFDYNQRGHQLYRVLAVDARSGAVRTVVEETSKTFIDYTQKTWRQWLDQTGELLWMSERDGWCHLWLYDLSTGKVKQQITHGRWVVRKVVHVDAAAREVWFMASGLRQGEDPYHEHLCRIKMDGSGFAALTEGDGEHRIEFSPGRDCFVDSWSRADQPPVTELRGSRDGRLIAVLERGEAAELVAAGWTLPERFCANGRDGKTDIYGTIIKPSHFQPNKKYPVVEEVYAGPHSAFSAKEFGRALRQHQIAELGFIVVQADGMGTNHRGKAFHDVCWKNLKDAGFPDRIAWIKAAAQTRPWMDLARVGIYGGSAGGQSAMRALLDHHDFYKAAVADCGCHDNRMDKIWWNEQWMGWPVDESYARNSNVDDAAKLEGHLLLLVGELDSNVDPASTMQVVGALQRAGKPFEFMPIVNTGHGAAETPFGSRLRMEFLARHLLTP